MKDVYSKEIQDLVAEYDSLTKEIFQLPDASTAMEAFYKN